MLFVKICSAKRPCQPSRLGVSAEMFIYEAMDGTDNESQRLKPLFFNKAREELLAIKSCSYSQPKARDGTKEDNCHHRHVRPNASSHESKLTTDLIAGGNAGLGLETVKSLLRSAESYHILLGGRKPEKAQQAAQISTSEIRSQSSVEPFQVDVESDESIHQAYQEISAKHPRIDCLVNNAGE